MLLLSVLYVFSFVALITWARLLQALITLYDSSERLLHEVLVAARMQALNKLSEIVSDHGLQRLVPLQNTHRSKNLSNLLHPDDHVGLTTTDFILLARIDRGVCQ